MDEDELTVTMLPKPGQLIPVRSFLRVIRSTERLLRGVERGMYPDHRAVIKWGIVRLSTDPDTGELSVTFQAQPHQGKHIPPSTS